MLVSRTIFADSTLRSLRSANAWCAGMSAFAAPAVVGTTAVAYVSKQIHVDGFSGCSDG